MNKRGMDQIITSLFPDGPLDTQDFSPFPTTVLRAVENRDGVALSDSTGNTEIRFDELGKLVRRFASGLSARGFKKSDVLAICCRNCPEFAVIFHGVLSVGGIVTTCNPNYTAEELSTQLQDCGAVYIVTEAPFLDNTQRASALSGCIQQIVCIENDTDPEILSYQEIINTDSEFPNSTILPDDVAVIPYSSGTSGVPKGVQITHSNLNAAVQMTNIPQLWESAPDEVVLAVLPFFHIYGLVILLNMGLLTGSKIVCLPRFKPATFLQACEKHRVTRLPVVPPIVLFLANDPRVNDYDLSSVRDILSGAAPLGAELEAQCLKRFKSVKFIRQGYGMTELSPVCTMTPLHKHKPGSCGVLHPNTECMIVDVGTGRIITEHNKKGELWIRGPQVMGRGYLNNPEATKESIDSDGFLHTGDVGYVDEDGFFFIVDRVKELIKYKGFQVAPAELESVLLSHTDITDAAVIGIADEVAGEVPVGYVVLKPGAVVTTKEIQEYVKEHVAPYKQLRRVNIVDDIPKSPTGKILRRVMKAEAIQQIGSNL